jgi:hypothetical protein
VKTCDCIENFAPDERTPRKPWHMCCLESRVQISAVAKPLLGSLATKGAIAFSLVLSALPLCAGELPSLRSPMARYETGSQHYAPLTRPVPVPAATLDFAIACLPRAVFNIQDAGSSTLAETPALQFNPHYLAKIPTRPHRWLAKDRSSGSVGLGRFLVGYGSVYYDSFYDKPMVIFEGKGTRVEEPGCGYLKMSFSF